MIVGANYQLDRSRIANEQPTPGRDYLDWVN